MPFPEYATEQEVPQDARDVYEKRDDGKWHAKVPDVAKLESTLAKVRDEKAEKAREAREANERAEALQRTADAKAQGMTDEAIQKIRDAEAAARKPIEEANAALEAENRKLKLTDRVQAAALKHGVMQDRIEDTMVLLGLKPAVQRVDLTSDGIGFVVKDRAGNVTTESLDDFLSKTHSLERKWVYAGTNSSGSGAQQSNGEGGSGGRYDPVADGKALAAQQKATREGNKLAFT